MLKYRARLLRRTRTFDRCHACAAIIPQSGVRSDPEESAANFPVRGNQPAALYILHVFGAQPIHPKTTAYASLSVIGNTPRA
jgi:hypothetical protein